jgi:hypothetical protein
MPGRSSAPRRAHNRTARAVERTVPSQLACQAVTACWYVTAGHDPVDVAEHRARAPWYAAKAQPAAAAHRRVDRRHSREVPPRHHRRQI